ncbi:hypothetical protein BD410DRAFT_800539 [Rickenella mellea]|uniref:HAT C-terminal dimerisation domain-containing protein n=1 Tax=Rickenella mellea TaxID=50990 RepID=A0A4Y7QHP9_9AGAM|nr:hypothetical protein BD410DRAFT_800539 [Rickenella mellea]
MSALLANFSHRQHFLEAMQRISKSADPLVHEVIPLIDKLTDILAAAVINESLHAAVCAAMAQGVEVINKYYSKTDNSLIPVILRSKGSPPIVSTMPWNSFARSTSNVTLLSLPLPLPYGNRLDKACSVFSDINNSGYNDSTDLIDDWILTPPVKIVQDPLTWWNGMLADSHPLAAMALDILSAPPHHLTALQKIAPAFGRLPISSPRNLYLWGKYGLSHVGTAHANLKYRCVTFFYHANHHQHRRTWSRRLLKTRKRQLAWTTELQSLRTRGSFALCLTWGTKHISMLCPQLVYAMRSTPYYMPSTYHPPPLAAGGALEPCSNSSETTHLAALPTTTTTLRAMTTTATTTQARQQQHIPATTSTTTHDPC